MRTSAVLLLLVACAGNPGQDLSIDLRTDFVPGGDFFSYVVTMRGQTPTRGVANTFQDFVTGVRIAEYTGLAAGNYDVQVQLLDANGLTVAERGTTVSIQTDTAVTVVMTRSCQGISCPGPGDAESATACVGGECVNPTCTPETPESCPVAQCTTAEDCGRPPQSCFAARCTGGVCFFGDDGSCGMGQFCDSLQGCTDRPTPSDGGTTDGGGRDTGVDAGVDTAPDPCDGVVCEGFTRCVGGSCEPFPGCFSDAECPGELSLCRNNNCVPGDLDIDGDGSPAAEDCNEADPNISPLAMELCNLMDEDCDEMIDEGNPGLLCADDPMGGECIDGACGCPPNQYDVDGVADNGCECTATPAMGMGMACGAPINLGDVRDDGQMQMVTGNLVPAGREIWYQFRAIDAPDTSCDNFHVDVRFMTNPDDTYRFNVFQGTCDSAVCPASGFTGFSWATDFRETLAGRRTGECPCTASSVNTTNVSKCSDNSQTYFLQVVRRMGAAVTCAPFEIQISNGLFDT